MSKTQLQRFGIALAILIFNLIAFFGGLIAIVYGIFKDEWIITILPAAIALIAIILQPWSLLLFLLPPITQPLHPFITTATPGFSFNDTGTEGVHIFLIWNSDSQRVNLLLRSNF